MSDMELSNNSRPSVDLAPLLPSPTRWTPALPRISEHTEEPSGSTARSQGSDAQPSTSHYSRVPRSSGEDSRPLLLAGATRYPEVINEHDERDERDNEPNSPTLSSSDEYSQPPVTHSSGSMSAEQELNIPRSSSSPRDAQFRTDNFEFDPPRAPFQTHGPYPFTRDPELDTPTVSASDSDSMQVNVPWRTSARFVPARTRSLPMESQSPDTPSTPGIQRHSYVQAPLTALSPLYLRAVTEEELERTQDDEHSHDERSPQSANKPPSVSSDSLDDDASTDPAPDLRSSLSSLSKLRLRFTGSAPFLPLIEESSPLDTENLFHRFNGDGSARSSVISKKSRRSRSKPRSSSRHSSSKASSSSKRSLSAFPMPPFTRSVSPKPPSPAPSPIAIREQVSQQFHLTPQTRGPLSLTSPKSPNTPFYSSPSRSQTSPFPLSSNEVISEVSATSLANSSSEPLPDPPPPAPDPPPTAREVPPIRPLPIRPLPTIPPPRDMPSAFPHKPPVTIPNDVESDLGFEMSVGPSPQTPWVNDSPLASSEEGYTHLSRRFSPGPSKLST